MCIRDRIVPVGGAYHAKKLALNASGYTVATFLYPIDHNSSKGQLDLKVIAGIPDRNFNVLTNGQYEHQFVYMPVINSATGRIWLNNNLGAEYADANNPNGNFNPKQQATENNDSLAYGSLFQWGRKADGHELIKWELSFGFMLGTGKYGITSTKSDNPTNPRFITSSLYPYEWRVHPDDTLWASESSPNNVCPVGYRLPLNSNGVENLDNEFKLETDSWSSKDSAGALSSVLKLSRAGLHDRNGMVLYENNYANYWSGSIIGDNASAISFGNALNVFSFGSRSLGMSVRCIKD